MTTNSAWLGKQIKSYVNIGIATWANLPNNPISKNGIVSTSQKPPLLTNYIQVSETCIVQAADFENPFTVKPLR